MDVDNVDLAATSSLTTATKGVCCCFCFLHLGSQVVKLTCNDLSIEHDAPCNTHTDTYRHIYKVVLAIVASNLD